MRTSKFTRRKLLTRRLIGSGHNYQTNGFEFRQRSSPVISGQAGTKFTPIGCFIMRGGLAHARGVSLAHNKPEAT